MTHDGRLAGGGGEFAARAAARAAALTPAAVNWEGAAGAVSPHGGGTAESAADVAEPDAARYANTARLHSNDDVSAADCSGVTPLVTAAHCVPMTPARAATVLATDALAGSCRLAMSDALSSGLDARPDVVEGSR